MGQRFSTLSVSDSEIGQCSEELTYLCPSLPVEHRPSTTPRHRTLFWAALAIPVQLVPCCFSSASVSRLQLLRGRPLFLFPCGFQVRTWRVALDAGFLKVVRKDCTMFSNILSVCDSEAGQYLEDWNNFVSILSATAKLGVVWKTMTSSLCPFCL